VAILFKSTSAAQARWQPYLVAAWPEREIRFWPDIDDRAAIDYALVWHPELGLLASLPNLKPIVSLGAGIDHVLRDPQLPPGVPIFRLVDPHMTRAMCEYVALQVLRLHRQDFDYRAQQAAGEWREHPQKNASERTVGILGFGVLGEAAGRTLQALGFDVAGWGRAPRQVRGFTTYADAAGLDQMLARSEILAACCR
jgi:glyoxylate/hydroxypyruvate reductase A